MAFFDDIYVKKPVNRQAAAGCQRIGESYDEKEFHPLAEYKKGHKKSTRRVPILDACV